MSDKAKALCGYKKTNSNKIYSILGEKKKKFPEATEL